MATLPNMYLQVGALGALTDRTMRVEVKLSSRDGLLWMLTLEFLSQMEINKLVPNPPPALKVFQALTRGQRLTPLGERGPAMTSVKLYLSNLSHVIGTLNDNLSYDFDYTPGSLCLQLNISCYGEHL